jgi:hypothetical protein
VSGEVVTYPYVIRFFSGFTSSLYWGCDQPVARPAEQADDARDRKGRVNPMRGCEKKCPTRGPQRGCLVTAGAIAGIIATA